MNLLDNLWKSATTPPDGKYENLKQKHCRRSDTKEKILINRFTEHFDGLVAIDNKGNWVTLHFIEYLDDSKEAVEALLFKVFRAGNNSSRMGGQAGIELLEKEFKEYFKEQDNHKQKDNE